MPPRISQNATPSMRRACRLRGVSLGPQSRRLWRLDYAESATRILLRKSTRCKPGRSTRFLALSRAPRAHRSTPLRRHLAKRAHAFVFESANTRQPHCRVGVAEATADLAPLFRTTRQVEEAAARGSRVTRWQKLKGKPQDFACVDDRGAERLGAVTLLRTAGGRWVSREPMGPAEHNDSSGAGYMG